MRRDALFGLMLGLLILSIACQTMTPAPSPSGGPQIRVEEAWVRPSLSGEQAAAYMVIHNMGDAADVLTGARSEIAGRLELHRTIMEGEVMRMEPVPRLEVPAGGRVELKPGGLHLMLMDLKQHLEAGQKVQLVLQFEKSGEVVVAAEVRMLEEMPMGH